MTNLMHRQPNDHPCFASSVPFCYFSSPSSFMIVDLDFYCSIVEHFCLVTSFVLLDYFFLQCRQLCLLSFSFCLLLKLPTHPPARQTCRYLEVNLCLYQVQPCHLQVLDRLWLSYDPLSSAFFTFSTYQLSPYQACLFSPLSLFSSPVE